MTALFLDANVPVYAAGRPHPLKSPCAAILQLVADHPGAFVTDAEVLQELLHRYLALRLWQTAGRQILQEFGALMRDRVEPVHAADVENAAILADRYPDLSARDLLHAALMGRLGVRVIVSADAGFDRLPEVERLDPTRVDAWRDKIPP